MSHAADEPEVPAQGEPDETETAPDTEGGDAPQTAPTEGEEEEGEET